MTIIFLGAPGAGKGTQAERISEKLAIPTISTGAILREAIQEETSLGKLAKSYMEQGALVPDDVVIGILRDRISREDCGKGYILDGFPRTLVQARALKNMGAKIDKVVNIHVPDEKIIERMSGRRVCLECGSSYHVRYKPPRMENQCDKCGAALQIRKDDLPEVVKNRLAVYHEMTAPLEAYYAKEGLLVNVEGQEELADTTKLTQKALMIE